MSGQDIESSTQKWLDSDSGPICREALGLPGHYVAPETGVELKVAAIWCKAFNIDQVGLNDNFFDLGGDSLTATLISTAIAADFGCKFQPSILMTRSTVAAVASLLEREVGEPESAGTGEAGDAAEDPPHLVAVRREGDLPPLFFIHGRLGLAFPGWEFVTGLDPRQPIYFIQALGYFDDTRPPRRIEEIADIYLATMRAKQPSGPLNIGSFCAGGIFAIEIAAKLVQANDPPASLILIDPPITKAMRRGKAPGTLDVLHWRLRIWWKLARLRFAGHWKLEKAIFARSDGTAEQYQKNLAAMAEVDPDFDGPMPGMARAAYNALQEAIYAAKPRRYDGPVDIVSSKELLDGRDPADHPWSGLLPNMRLHMSADRHAEMFRSEAGAVARKVQERILAGQNRATAT